MRSRFCHPTGEGWLRRRAETNTVTVLEAPAAPPLPDATTSEPKPPPVTRDTEPVEDIVPLIPEPSEGPEVPVAAGEIEYVVAKGDNFTNIASRHGVTVQAIIMANPAVDSNRMQIGQVLIIPAPAAKPPGPSLPEGTVVYEVQTGRQPLRHRQGAPRPRSRPSARPMTSAPLRFGRGKN